MRNWVRFGMLMAVSIAVAATFLLDGTAQDKAKYTIKEVMKKAHKEGVLQNAVAGKATKEQLESLVEMYNSLTQNKPPKGEAASWKEKTDAMVTGAKVLLKDSKDKAAAATLKKAADCKGCHSVHKG